MIPPNIASPPTNLRSGSSTENEGFALRRIQKHYRKKSQQFEILKYELQGLKIQNPKARNTLKDTRDEREGSAVRLEKRSSHDDCFSIQKLDLPAFETGIVSPYPTVVIVVMAHQSVSKIDLHDVSFRCMLPRLQSRDNVFTSTSAKRKIRKSLVLS